MGVVLTTGGAIGGALGGGSGYLAGQMLEKGFEECELHPGLLPKAYAIGGVGIGAVSGRLVQLSCEGKLKGQDHVEEN